MKVHEVKVRLDLSRYVETHAFSFDAVFSGAHDNVAVYEETARPLVGALFAGWRSTCFAYGQTGTGKTYTMEGTPGNPGLYLLAVRDVFEGAAREAGVAVWISFFEIYGAKLYDLLNGRERVECREDGQAEVRIQGLVERCCETPEDVLALIALAASARSTGVTGANDDSSRSHAVFQIELRRGADEVGRLSFVDLAGSERGSDTASNTAQTRREGAEINKSLLALKECIRAMDQGHHHTPFRGSKLTQVLKASFIGRAKCRTVMIANVSPAALNVEHTLNTLRYSQRVKELKRAPPERAATFAYGIPPPRSHSARVLPPRAPLPPMSPDITSLTGAPPPPAAHLARAPSAERRHSAAGLRANGDARANGDPAPSLRAPRRRVPGARSMIPTSSRGRRATLSAGVLEDALPLFHAAARPVSDPVGGDAAAAAALDRGALRDEEARVRRLVSEPVVSPRRAPRPRPAEDAGADDGEPREEGGGYGSADDPGTVGNTRPRALAAADALDEDGVEDEDLLYSAASLAAPPPRAARTRRMVVPAAARRRSNFSRAEGGGPLRASPPPLPPPPPGGMQTRSQARAAAGSGSAPGTPVARARPGGAGSLGDDAAHVVALHREKAEELTALMREGVELMHAVEEGRVRPGAYATKLEVNLALSMDILHTLKTHVAALGAAERR